MRRRRNRTRSALGVSNLHSLKGALNSLFARMDRCTMPPAITPQQVVAMFASPEDREILQKVMGIVATNKYWREDEITTTFGNYNLTFDVGHTVGEAPFLPKTPVLQPDVLPSLIEELVAYAERRSEIRWQFGRLEKALESLDDHCSNATQVRYLWPSVMALARVSGLEGLAEKLQVCNVPSQVPGLPPGLREALRQGAGTIAAAALLEEDDSGAVKEFYQKYARIEAVEKTSSYRDDGFGTYGPK